MSSIVSRPFNRELSAFGFKSDEVSDLAEKIYAQLSEVALDDEPFYCNDDLLTRDMRAVWLMLQRIEDMLSAEEFHRPKPDGPSSQAARGSTHSRLRQSGAVPRMSLRRLRA